MTLRPVRPDVLAWEGPAPGGEGAGRVGHALVLQDGVLLVDPPPLAVPARAFGGRPVTAVILTLSSHDRAAGALGAHFRAPIHAPREGLDQLTAAGVAVSHAYGAGERLPGGLRPLPTRRTGEYLLWYEPRRYVFAGHALASQDGQLAAPGLSAEALRELVELAPEAIFLGHGEDVPEGAEEALRSLLPLGQTS